MGHLLGPMMLPCHRLKLDVSMKYYRIKGVVWGVGDNSLQALYLLEDHRHCQGWAFLFSNPAKKYLAKNDSNER
jgi:hypothetical protein